MTLSIKEIEARLTSMDEFSEEFLTNLYKDERKGVQVLVKRLETRRQKQLSLEKMHIEMTKYENEHWQEGSTIAGLDEVGRGPLAGPVVAAAVILPTTFKLLGLTDSKQLTKAKREEFATKIRTEALAYSIQMVHVNDIDQINIYQSTKLAMTRALQNCSVQPDHLLLDAISLPIDLPQTSLIKGDQKSISIAASSVLAKVERDRYMELLDAEYPGYGFRNHKGYGTKEHIDAIKRLGVMKEHRRSFQPVKEFLSSL